MKTQTPDSREQQDQAYNPSQEYYDDKFNEMTQGYSSSADDLQQLENYANEGGSSKEEKGSKNDSSPTDNIDQAKSQEDSGAGWVNNYSGGEDKGNTGRSSNKMKINFLKKKGPIGFIAALLFGGGSAFTVLFSPGIGLVQLKEALVDSLNDQAAAMDLFSDHMFRAKLKGMQSGVCGNKVSIRCKFNTMSKRQVTAFKNAGIQIEPNEPDKTFGRTKPTKYTFPDGTVVTTPQQLNNYLRNSVEGRSAMKRAFNPTFAGAFDKLSNGFMKRMKTDKSKKVEGSTKEERDEAITSATAGQQAGVGADGKLKDEKGNEYVIDEDGKKVYAKEPEGGVPEGARVDEGKFNEISEKNASNMAGIEEKKNSASPGSKAVSGAFKNGLKGISVLGAADTGCTVWNTARAVAAAAKATRLMQLVQFVMVFFVTADRIKAGTATQDEVSHLGDKLTAVDMQKEIVDEGSVWEGDSPENAEAKARPNPYYGKNAFDAPGYKTAAYNEAPKLTSRDQQYTIGGGLVGSFTGVLDKIADLAGGRDNIRSFCSVVQSWWARAAGLIAGLVSAVGSFGVSTAVSIGASVAIGFAMPFLEAALADIMAGTVVSGATEGIDAGDAAFAGAGGLLGGMAMAHGMRPANKNQLKDYLKVANEVKREQVAVLTYEARETPFDINNQYSFLGSAVRKVNPALIGASSSITGAITSIPSIISAGFSSLVPHASAAQSYNEERFEQCGGDQGYHELGIDADVFCNPRYIPGGLNIEPDEAARWMLENEHIEDDENGTPKSDEFKDWIKFCTEREDGWGETGNSDDNSDEAIGLTCVNKDKSEEEIKRLDYFNAFWMYHSLNDTMDNGYDTAGGDETGATTAGGTWVNPSGGTKYEITSDYGPRVLNGANDFHDGTDMSFAGDFVAACTGKITGVGKYGDWSGRSPTNIITIDCGGGVTTKYMHYYTRDLASGIDVGKEVTAGTKLAKVGNQGHSFGAHLHFQIEQNGKSTDPVAYMKKVGVQL
ncbi:MAG TPA: M23 family metallopeptidase [Candidatus Saccharimonadales bacterium]